MEMSGTINCSDFARSDVVSPEMIKPVCKEILDALGLDYIDSFQV